MNVEGGTKQGTTFIVEDSSTHSTSIIFWFIQNKKLVEAGQIGAENESQLVVGHWWC